MERHTGTHWHPFSWYFWESLSKEFSEQTKKPFQISHFDWDWLCSLLNKGRHFAVCLQWWLMVSLKPLNYKQISSECVIPGTMATVQKPNLRTEGSQFLPIPFVDKLATPDFGDLLIWTPKNETSAIRINKMQSKTGTQKIISYKFHVFSLVHSFEVVCLDSNPGILQDGPPFSGTSCMTKG